MIKNPDYLKKFEHDLIAQSTLTHDQALAIVESLREEASGLGLFPPQNLLEGIETDIRVARIVNSCSKP